jgi:hypothetical protein
MLTASGLLTRAAIPGTYGTLLFLLAGAFGLFSFIRLFGLASADGRKRLLSRALAGALGRVPAAGPGLKQGMDGDRVLGAYLGQLDEAAARSDGNGVRDLVEELAVSGSGSQATAALHLIVTHRLAKAALVGKLDPLVASAAIETVIGSVLTGLTATLPGEGAGLRGQRAAAVMGQASRYLAWLANTCLSLSVRQVTTASAARELVALSLRVRHHILRLADPDPPYAAGTTDLGTPLAAVACVLAWISGFTEFHGSDQAAGLYPVYEILTGTKFLGNYWDGDSVLTGLRDALFSADAIDAQAAEATRRAFGTASEFDRVWTLISVAAIATLRDVRLAHPPELIRPEFSPDPQLLGAYLRTFATHRYFTTAAQAMTALTATIGQAGQAGELWQPTRAASEPLSWTVPMPATQPHRRPSACALSIASRLAPLTAAEPDHELRAFLSGLPGPVIDATARLASRVLPDPEPGSGDSVSPAELVISRLRVLQLVGTHRAGTT